ncbi:hypothetical protein [Photobacterium aquae]|uniref:hypothetical protein n=1 Tax=Photobacterium aquae TaxID=1195763 RepID=UPI0012EE5EF6|nr:hypothetical protein [Photobacterium aquae]
MTIGQLTSGGSDSLTSLPQHICGGNGCNCIVGHCAAVCSPPVSLTAFGVVANHGGRAVTCW